jgi:TetR/AcrR family transcriptional repressor of mexCD-oprJ operon
MHIGTHEEKLLKKLAAAISANPRSNTGALAEAAGISRATFNRFCGSRKNLMEMIAKQAKKSLQEIISLAQETVTDYTESLSSLIDVHFQNQEYLVFVSGNQSSLDATDWDRYLNALDTFFLGGQKAGVFRVDMPNKMLTELFVSMLCGMIDAQQRSRVASFGLESQMTAFFLHGISP